MTGYVMGWLIRHMISQRVFVCSEYLRLVMVPYFGCHKSHIEVSSFAHDWFRLKLKTIFFAKLNTSK